MKEIILAISLFGLMVSSFAVWAIGFSAPVASITQLESKDDYTGKVYPVVLELFTSQGCSSCPPADKLLASLESEEKILGAPIIPLSFHVDYWDRLGWKDPYSSPDFSKRQTQYAYQFRQNNYTPQLVVDGTTQFVGSNRGKALQTIDQARRVEKVDLGLAATRLGDQIRFNVTSTEPLPADAQLQLVVALTLDHVEDNVTRGENQGRKLEHNSVVVFLNSVDLMNGLNNLDQQLSFPATILPDSQSAAHAVALLQNKSTLQIIGAARAPLKGQ